MKKFFVSVFRSPGIDTQIQAILQKELEDAEQKESDPTWNEEYGNIGSDVRSGVYKAENAIKSVAKGRPLRKRDIPRIQTALERAVKQYRMDNEDPAGYGVGTLYNIIRAIVKLQEESEL